MKAKICGITTLDDARMAIEAKADFIGIILSKKSKRTVSIPDAKVILSKIKDFQTQVVGVFLDEPIQEIAQTLKELELEWVQLLAPKSLKELSPLEHLNKLLVIRVGSTGNYDSVEYANPKGYWLYDGSEPGSGKLFNWDAFKQKEMGPFFIAGGLSSKEVPHAHERFHPDGLDVASGVSYPNETRKDPKKVQEFIEKVHDAE